MSNCNPKVSSGWAALRVIYDIVLSTYSISNIWEMPEEKLVATARSAVLELLQIGSSDRSL